MTHQDMEHILLDATFWKRIESALVFSERLWGYIKAADTDGCEYTAYVYRA